MSEKICASCRKPKANRSCGLCNEPLCKACSQFLEESSFSFLEKVPEELSHSTYCQPCYNTTVAPALDSYDETMERAKQVYVFFKLQRKPIPLIKRSKKQVEVSNIPDRDEAILRLAFLASQESFNAVVDVNVIMEKVRNQGYEKSKYQGTGFPAQVDASKLAWDDE